MLAVGIDGSAHTGTYRIECQCGTAWGGRAELFGRVNYSPALPIAEVVVHAKMAHGGVKVDMRFSSKFEDWLVRYWEREGLRRERAGEKATSELASRGEPLA